MRARTLIYFFSAILFLLSVPTPAFAATNVINDITSNTRWTIEGSPYVVSFDNNKYVPHLLTVAAGAMLIIDPGVIVKFRAYNGIAINGALQAEGTVDNPIIFTSFKDDSAGGDTNNDGIATTPADEQWMHIEFYAGSNGIFDNTTVRYGGARRGLVFNTGIENYGGTLTIGHTTLAHNGRDGLGQYGGHTILSNSLIFNQAVGINMRGGVLDISDTRIHDNFTSGIDHRGGALSIMHSEIDHNGTGIVVKYQGSIAVNNSSLHDNTSANSSLGIDNQSTDISIDARNNWWGDASGPSDSVGNTAGIGNGIKGNVVYSPWLTSDPFTPSDPCVATNSCASNVLFLPGIEASRLYRPNYNGGTDKVWEPNTDGDVQDLYMNPDGTSARFDVYTKERDVIDELADGENIYKSFIAKMDGLKTSGAINDWEPVAYDWRLSLDDILNYGNDVQGRIYYSGDLRATSTPYVIQELKRLATASKTGKVTIVAHSNGGLVAKRLTELLGSTESARLIDKMIFVAVPQAGTPAAIPAGLHGYEQDHILGLITSKNTARTFASNSPMEYQLLPSSQYFTYVDDPVVAFDSALTDWISRYGAAIHSQDRLHAFLTDSYGRVDAQIGDIDQPIQFSSSLLSSTEALHTSLDNWTPPAGVSLIQIAGWGVPKTVEGITYKKNGTGIRPEADFTIDGDGTVVVPSVLWASTAVGATNYWVDLRSYNSNHPADSGLGFLIFDHSKILEPKQLLDFLSDQITNTTKPLSDYIYLSTVAPANSDKRLRYALHSPLTLNLYDNEGRHTGVSTSTGKVEEQIPGTYYTEFGDAKYIFSDASDNAHIVMNGYATSTFTFNVDEYIGDTLTASTTFRDMPTTPSTIVSLGVQSDISTLSPMQIDKNSDGVIDYTIVPRMNDVATLYRWDGFLQPINDTAHQVWTSTSIFKGGSTIPVKFQLKKADGTIIQAATAPIWLPPLKGSSMSTPVDKSVYSSTGTSGTVYKWDATSQQYVYNWNTKSLKTGSWYQIFVQLDDGNTYSVTIGLK